MRDPRLVLISWVDSHVDSGWKTITEARDQAARAVETECHSAGYLIDLTEEYALMTLSYWPTAAEAHVTDTLQIPRSAITNVKRLATGRSIQLWHD